MDNDDGNIKLYYQDFDLEALYGLYTIDFTTDTTPWQLWGADAT